MYIAGIEPCSQRCNVTYMLFAYRDINLLSGRSEGVSIGGITSAIVIPTSPPTIIPTAGPQCQSAPGRPRHSSDVNSVRFGAMSYDYNTTVPSFLGFTLTDRQKDFFKSR